METTFVQQHCVISAHSMEEVEKELVQVHSHFRTAFGAPRSGGDIFTGGDTAKAPAARKRTASARTRTRTQTTTARKAPQRLRGTRRAQTGNGHVSDEQMLSALEGKDGITAKELASQLGISHQTALRKLGSWQKAGKAFRQGERNKTRWFAQQPALVT